MIDEVQYNSIKWHHILNPTESDYEYLSTHFNFHPLVIDDCRSKTQRPKVDTYDDYYFLILHFPFFDKTEKFIITKEIKIFWAKDFLITVGNSHKIVNDLFISAKEDQKILEDLLSGGTDFLLYKILENTSQKTVTLLQKLGIHIENISVDLFNKKAVQTIEKISFTRKNIILLDTIFKPQLRLFRNFESGEIKGFTEDMEEYWGNILDYYQKTWDMIEDYEEMTEGYSKTFDSLQANKTNEIMRVLTFISTTLLPLTFITGLYGMNIGLPFQNHPYSFWIVVGFMFAIVIALLIFFKRKKLM